MAGAGAISREELKEMLTANGRPADRLSEAQVSSGAPSWPTKNLGVRLIFFQNFYFKNFFFEIFFFQNFFFSKFFFKIFLFKIFLFKVFFFRIFFFKVSHT
jgi:hypothetical protein